MSRIQPKVQRLVASALLVCAASLAGLGASHAASSTTTVNGMPCNELCKAYMSWSDRMMAKFLPPRPQMRPLARAQSQAQMQSQARAAMHDRKPDRVVHHAAAPRRSGLNSFAQFPQAADAAPPAADAQRTAAAAPGAAAAPANPVTDRFPTDAVVTAAMDTGRAASEFPETVVVPATDSVAMPAASTIAAATGDQETRFPASLALALSAFVAFLAWGWFRDKRAAEAHY